VSVGDGSEGVPAGWYPDPADESRLRRWDGATWTQDVILAPEQSAVGFVPPQSTPAPTERLAPPVPTIPAPQPPAPAPAATPAPTPAAPQSQQPTARTEPVYLPEWASLPGITLPPDLSSIPGFQPETIVITPTFEDAPAPEPALPKPTFEKPVFEQEAPQPAAPPPPPAPPIRPTADFPPPPTPPRRGGSPAPAENYAPPPHGAQYDVPPPPGASRVPGPGLALPASSLVAQQPAKAAWASGPDINRAAIPPADFSTLPRTSVPAGELDETAGGITLWVWLIVALPVIQFVVVFLLYGALGFAFVPGTEWAILAAPALFGLLLASADRRILVDQGALRPPSPLLAIVPPVYLLVRAIDVGRMSVIALVTWFVLQAAAIIGVSVLLPHVLAQAIASVR